MPSKGHMVLLGPLGLCRPTVVATDLKGTYSWGKGQPNASRKEQAIQLISDCLVHLPGAPT